MDFVIFVSVYPRLWPLFQRPPGLCNPVRSLPDEIFDLPCRRASRRGNRDGEIRPNADAECLSVRCTISIVDLNSVARNNVFVLFRKGFKFHGISFRRQYAYTGWASIYPSSYKPDRLSAFSSYSRTASILLSASRDLGPPCFHEP